MRANGTAKAREGAVPIILHSPIVACASFPVSMSILPLANSVSGQALVGRNADFFFIMYLKSLVPKASLDTATDDNLLLETPSTNREVCLGIQPVLLDRLDQFP